MGNACEGNLLRLRLCFEACFMGWVWRIRTNECWIGRVLSFSFVLYCKVFVLWLVVSLGMFHMKHGGLFGVVVMVLRVGITLP